jgi:arylformamidase
MKIHDISLPIFEGMPVYKNKPEKQPSFEVVSNFPTATSRETRVHLDVHTGTHVDAPLHMMPNGETTDSLHLERLVRSCMVLDLTGVQGGISDQDLRVHSIVADDFLLFKTRNSNDRTFNPEFIYLAQDGAEYLAELGIAGVGIDALGIERSQPGHPTHKSLFQAGAVIIEGLQLSNVEPGHYLMVAAPLRLQGLDAAPARVLLIEE